MTSRWRDFNHVSSSSPPLGLEAGASGDTEGAPSNTEACEAKACNAMLVVWWSMKSRATVSTLPVSVPFRVVNAQTKIPKNPFICKSTFVFDFCDFIYICLDVLLRNYEKKTFHTLYKRTWYQTLSLQHISTKKKIMACFFSAPGFRHACTPRARYVDMLKCSAPQLFPARGVLVLIPPATLVAHEDWIQP